jgi:hypothetical protein
MIATDFAILSNVLLRFHMDADRNSEKHEFDDNVQPIVSNYRLFRAIIQWPFRVQPGRPLFRRQFRTAVGRVLRNDGAT